VHGAYQMLQPDWGLLCVLFCVRFSSCSSLSVECCQLVAGFNSQGRNVMCRSCVLACKLKLEGMHGKHGVMV
jgi:hypothetical protein